MMQRKARKIIGIILITLWVLCIGLLLIPQTTTTYVFTEDRLTYPGVGLADVETVDTTYIPLINLVTNDLRVALFWLAVLVVAILLVWSGRKREQHLDR